MISSAHAFESKLPVRRIGFAGDFLRFSIGKTGYSSSQTRNIAWLRELITGARRWPRRDVGAEVIAPIDGLAMDFEADGATAAAIEEYRCDAELAWARRYDTTTPDVLPALFDALTRYDLIVGFELSPTIKRHLNAHSIRYVSFHVHALRMLRDLCLDRDTSLRPLLRAADLVTRFFCVGEALSIPLLRATWKAAEHPLPRAVLGRIVKDEAAHGVFGWYFLDWAAPSLSADDREHLRQAAETAIAQVKRLWDDLRRRPKAPPRIHALGWMQTDAYLSLAATSLQDDVIAPLRARGILVAPQSSESS